MPKKKAFLLRMQPELWDEVSRWAADELRSVNGHIEFLLREAVRKRRGGLKEGRAEGPEPPEPPEPPEGGSGAGGVESEEGGA